MFHFIVNSHGGSGKAQKTWDTVQKILAEKNISYQSYITQGVGHATELARQICSQEKEVRLIVVGGDGTIDEVLNGISDFSKVHFGVIPTGSGNDFAGGAKIPGNTRKAVERILNSTQDTIIDIGMVRTEEKTVYFGISAGIGMDAIVCKRALTSRLKNVLNFLHMGKLTYILLTIHTLFSMKKENVTLTFDGGEPELCKGLIFLAAMNFRAEGGGVPMAPDADATDGKLSMCLASGIAKFVAFLDFPLLVMAKHTKLRGFAIRDFTTLDIHCDAPMVLHHDGEYGGDVKDIHFECLPKKLALIS